MKTGNQQFIPTFSKISFALVFGLSLLLFSTTISAQKNIALGKRAYQSSTKYGASASRAVDGVRNGFWHNNSVTCTESESGSWWEVDLGAVYSINKVVIYNRTDSGSERLASMQVYYRQDNQSSAELLYALSGQPGIKIDIEKSKCVDARFITIKLGKQEHLSLAEVEVYGTACGEEIAKPKAKSTNSRLAYQKVQLYTSSLY